MNKSRCAEILAALTGSRVLVVGDIMLDHFIWGRATRISPEAPIPIVHLERESFMPGGAANVARNLTKLGAHAILFGVTGHDTAARKLAALLRADGVDVSGLVAAPRRHTSTKMRIIAGQQQVTRLDCETNGALDATTATTLRQKLDTALDKADAVIVGDYGKGVITPKLLATLRRSCSKRKLWLSLDPKPAHTLDLRGLSLLTPNRREAFQLAGLPDSTRSIHPMEDQQLLKAANRLIQQLCPTVLLITLGELGMLLCIKGQAPLHFDTVARQVFDVSGAGDTVIASFTIAIVAGASPAEAAVFSNHAAGVVVGKIGTASVDPHELHKSFSYFK
jgi:rfaE bifunctional protein kinase chain/domain